MIKNFLITFLIIGSVVSMVYFTVVSKNKPVKYRTVRIPIDSVSVDREISFLPDETWTYHTKYGPTATSRNKQIYKVGDTITIQLVKLRQ